MAWKVMVGADEEAWAHGSAVPIDPPSGWKEAWDGIIPGYVATHYEREALANQMARAIRAWGFSAATQRA